MIGFANETEMVDAYAVFRAQNVLLSAIAIVFEQYNENDIRYKIRQSWKLPNNLYQSTMDEHLKLSPTLYFDIIPITQVQMCVDEALINQKAPGAMPDIKVLYCTS